MNDHKQAWHATMAVESTVGRVGLALFGRPSGAVRKC
jgi:hypothetical protein